MNKICLNCGEEFKTNNSKRKYCGRKCYSETINKKVLVVCSNCGKKHERQLRDINRYKKLYCSIECRNVHSLVGENSPFYKEKTKKKCVICHKDILVRENRIRENNVCGNKCRKELMRIRCLEEKANRIVKSCSYCGKDIKRSKSDYKNKKLYFCNRVCKHNWQRENLFKENAYAWKGGNLSLSVFIRTNEKYLKIRNLCYERDHFRSILLSKNKKLNHHHLKSLSIIIRENNITKENWEDFSNLLFDINNVVTLAEEEHLLFHSIYGKITTKDQFEEFKNNYLRKYND